MKLHASGEDYLEAVLIIERKKGAVRSIDIAEWLGVTKPSVSRAVSLLKKGRLYLCKQQSSVSDRYRPCGYRKDL